MNTLRIHMLYNSHFETIQASIRITLVLLASHRKQLVILAIFITITVAICKALLQSWRRGDLPRERALTVKSVRVKDQCALCYHCRIPGQGRIAADEWNTVAWRGRQSIRR